MRVHKRLIDIVDPTPKTIDSLQRIELPAGVDIEIKIQSPSRLATGGCSASSSTAFGRPTLGLMTRGAGSFAGGGSGGGSAPAPPPPRQAAALSP